MAAVQKKTRIAAPQLTFDDGSRAVQESPPSYQHPQQRLQRNYSTRDSPISIREFYEIDRLVQEIHQLQNKNESMWKKRIALQLPDELLSDAPDVCWEFEKSLSADTLVFTLGDTTYQHCCPDEVTAAHLEADCIVHYGDACLIACHIPVLYSFGKADMALESVVPAIIQATQTHSVCKLVVLFQVKYHSQIPEFAIRTRHQANIEVVYGQIPKSVVNPIEHKQRNPTNPSNCGDGCCQARISAPSLETHCDERPSPENSTFFTGGLELPPGLGRTPFTLLFVGDESSLQFRNIVLTFLSTKSPPKHFWIWKPQEQRLLTEDISPRFQRQLNRRFYLVQKARLATVFGLLVANLSDQSMRRVVEALDRMIKQRTTGRQSYILAVGKVNPAKLANFPEIDCFVLVACPEHSLLEDDRDFSTPIITPAELSLALGVTEWGTVDYSLDSHDFLHNVRVHDTALQLPENGRDQDAKGVDDKDDDDDDAPYFNPVSGQYESLLRTRREIAGKNENVESDHVNLSVLPGQGVLTNYHSAAADFLKQREYQGLQVQAGQTEVRIAAPGQDGIASNYNDR